MFKPMLAPNDDPKKNPNFFKELRYPLLCSPKFDGIRGIIKNGQAISRSGELLPSLQVQDEFCDIEHLDGELIEGCVTDTDVYNRTQSHVMSKNKPGNMSYFVFDYTHPDWWDRPFYERLAKALDLVKEAGTHRYVGVEHTLVECYEELVNFENENLSANYEGIMMRDPVGRYKRGRGTFKEGLIYKLKRFQDNEGTIVGYEERQHNTNTLQSSELGYAKRSQSKSGLVGANTLGKFKVLFNGEIIDIAPGAFTHKQLQHIWDHSDNYLGAILKFRHFAHGAKSSPRFPRAVGFRDKMDM